MSIDKTHNETTRVEARTWSRVFREYGESILIAVVLAMILRTFVVQAFKIPSGSMEPTLLVGDHILVNKFIYGVRIPLTNLALFDYVKPRRGDVIVFITPEDKDEGYWKQRDFIKRVVGIEGDSVEVKDKRVYINGKLWDDVYGVHTDTGIRPERDNFGPVSVPKNSLFMMGDNRDHSNDSRFWGFVDLSEVRGKAFVIYWSWDREKHWPRVNRLFNLVH